MGTPPVPSRVVIAYDATRDRGKQEFRVTIRGLRVRGDILHGGDNLLVLGVLHRVTHPMGYQTPIGSADHFAGTSIRAMEEEVSQKVESYVTMLRKSAEECEDAGVGVEVKITAGSSAKKVILQEVITCNAAWVLLDRHFRRDYRFYNKQIPCRVAFIRDDMTLEVIKNKLTDEQGNIGYKSFYSMSKHVQTSNSQPTDSIQEQSAISFCRSFPVSFSSQESTEIFKSNFLPNRLSLEHGSSSKQDILGTQDYNQYQKNQRRQKFSEAPILCATCGMKTELHVQDAMKFSFSDIQLATDDFSKDNLLGEGGYGHVYKGEFTDGQLIAAKVRKEASTQGFTEFHSELYVLSFARHKNIVMLLGYCCKENLNILVYEYICNRSLHWHLFDKSATTLEWHQRYAIAIGTAKGLRFLHEECRAGPIIHRDMRPSNILLTHDFVPMLGDFGLARWKIGEDPVHTRILGTLGYLAPEYAENGLVSVRTDVYAYGIVLLQLISGRKAVDLTREDQSVSIRQWAETLIEKLALHELLDPRIEETYDTYELYLMTKVAYLCVQRSPELRPSMGEVVRLLEKENEHFNYLVEQFVPHFAKK
ncbi:hypothetical protein ACFE04_025660 [Oxalis oulophora]